VKARLNALEYDRTGFFDAEDGTRLFYGIRGEGDGLPVMLNDGIGCDGFVWHYLQPHLAEERKVIHWHYRGHGRSGPPRERDRLTIAGLAHDLRGLMDHLEIERAIQVGHSMGTQVQLELFRLEPKRVGAFVFLCGSCGRITHSFHGSDVLSQILPGIRANVQRHRGVARALWGRVPPALAYRLARVSGEVDPNTIREDDFRRYWEHVCVMDPDDFLDLLQAAGEHSAEDLLAKIAVPTLVVAAERDTFTPPERAESMGAAITEADVFVIRGGSHAAPVEQPMTVQLRLDKFLGERVDTLTPESRRAG